MPETSRSLHYWQPAPRRRLLPWLAHPGKQAMNPTQKGEKQSPLGSKNMWNPGTCADLNVAEGKTYVPCC